MNCVRVPFARRLSDGRFVDASMVPSGKGCRCVCGACESPLIARHPRNTNRIHHFAHKADFSRQCKFALETALHRAAKQAVSELDAIWLPPTPAMPAMQLMISQAHIEKPFRNFVPDILIEDSSGRKIAIEIRVAHQVDQEKRKKLQLARLDTVEIDLRKTERFILYPELVKLLAGDRLPCAWLFNADVQRKIEDEERLKEEWRRIAEADRAFSEKLGKQRVELAAKYAAQERKHTWQKLMPWVHDS